MIRNVSCMLRRVSYFFIHVRFLSVTIKEKPKESIKMRKFKKTNPSVSIGFFAAFALWTIAVRFLDVQSIGPKHSAVGLAGINGAVRECIGSNMTLYTITDWLGILPLCFVFGFGILGLVQWIRRKNIVKVDYDILVLGAFYVAVMAAYLLFEIVVVNYRPVLINGYLEASYPSSTTMLVLCVMPTASLQFKRRIKNKTLKIWVLAAIQIFIIFMVAGRLVSGVHWFSDIIGGILLSAGFVTAYHSLAICKRDMF